jgi:glycosyltransferase involved in cell wall biosynthesis
MDGELNMPEISVIMSVYNGAKRLRKSVESILSQEDVDFEFVVINDGSTDDSGNILEEYASHDKRLRVMHQENKGLTASLIKGCAEARGKYIARQDADDISMPGRLKALSDFLNQHNDVILAFSWLRCIAPGGEIIQLINPDEPIEKTTEKLRCEMIGVPAHGCVIFRKNAYERAGGYHKEFYYAQDCDLWLRMAWLGNAGCVKNYLYDLHFDLQGISSRCQDMQKQFAELARQCYKARLANESEAALLLQAAALSEQAHRDRDRKISSRNLSLTYYLIGSGLDRQNSEKASVYYKKAIQASPVSLRAWRGIITHYIRRLIMSVLIKQ